MRLIKFTCLLPLVLILLSACSIVGVTEITGYKVIVEVKDTNGDIVQNALVTSNADGVDKEKPGVYSLLYGKTGLYVVTIAAPDKQTKQIKVSVPADKDKVFSVVLNDK